MVLIAVFLGVSAGLAGATCLALYDEVEQRRRGIVEGRIVWLTFESEAAMPRPLDKSANGARSALARRLLKAS